MENVTIELITKEGKSCKMGDTITITNGVETKVVEVNLDNLSFLINKGIVKSMKVVSNKLKTYKIPMDVEYYIEKVANRMHWNYNKVINYFNTLNELNPIIPINIILKEIALELEKGYTGHIKDCSEVYGIGSTSGEVRKLSIGNNPNFKCFSAFRTKEDAELAKEILKEFFDDIYGKQED